MKIYRIIICKIVVFLLPLCWVNLLDELSGEILTV